MTRDEIVNRLLDAKPTDEIIISIGDITVRKIKIKDIAFTPEHGKLFVSIPDTNTLANVFD